MCVLNCWRGKISRSTILWNGNAQITCNEKKSECKKSFHVILALFEKVRLTHRHFHETYNWCLIVSVAVLLCALNQLYNIIAVTRHKFAARFYKVVKSNESISLIWPKPTMFQTSFCPAEKNTKHPAKHYILKQKLKTEWTKCTTYTLTVNFDVWNMTQSAKEMWR